MNPCQACWDALAEARAENKTIRADEREKWAEEKAAMERVIMEAVFYHNGAGPIGRALDALDNYRNTSKGEGGE
jgi:hypothetical protein